MSWNDEPSAGWRLLRPLEEVSGSVAATCRSYGISRQCFYGWRRRYEAAGLEGLKEPFESAAPLTQHHRCGGGGEDQFDTPERARQPDPASKINRSRSVRPVTGASRSARFAIATRCNRNSFPTGFGLS